MHLLPILFPSLVIYFLSVKKSTPLWIQAWCMDKIAFLFVAERSVLRDLHPCLLVRFIYVLKTQTFSSFLETCLLAAYFKEGWSFYRPIALTSAISSLWMSSPFPFPKMSWILVFYLMINIAFARQHLPLISFLAFQMSGWLLGIICCCPWYLKSLWQSVASRAMQASLF